MRLRGKPSKGASVPMNVLELVDFAGRLGRISLRVAAQRIESHTSRRHGVCMQLVVSDEVGVRVEVELLLIVVQNRRHGTLPHALDALLLRATNLLPDPFSVIVLDLLKPA